MSLRNFHITYISMCLIALFSFIPFYFDSTLSFSDFSLNSNSLIHLVLITFGKTLSTKTEISLGYFVHILNTSGFDKTILKTCFTYVVMVKNVNWCKSGIAKKQKVNVRYLTTKTLLCIRNFSDGNISSRSKEKIFLFP